MEPIITDIKRTDICDSKKKGPKAQRQGKKKKVKVRCLLIIRRSVTQVKSRQEILFV